MRGNHSAVAASQNAPGRQLRKRPPHSPVERFTRKKGDAAEDEDRMKPAANPRQLRVMSRAVRALMIVWIGTFFYSGLTGHGWWAAVVFFFGGAVVVGASLLWLRCRVCGYSLLWKPTPGGWYAATWVVPTKCPNCNAPIP